MAFAGQGHGAAHNRSGALGSIHDLERRLVDEAIVERLEADADSLVLHVSSLKSDGRRATRRP